MSFSRFLNHKKLNEFNDSIYRFIKMAWSRRQYTPDQRANWILQFELSPSLRPSRLQRQQEPFRKRSRYHSDSDWLMSDAEDELVRLHHDGEDETVAEHLDSDIVNLLHLVQPNNEWNISYLANGRFAEERCFQCKMINKVEQSAKHEIEVIWEAYFTSCPGR